MKRPSLAVAVPWNLSRYIPRNGFHPLYKALFEERQLDFNVLDEVEFTRTLNNSSMRVRDIRSEVSGLLKALARDWGGLPIASGFIDHVTPEELWLTNAIPGELEFHHTSPLTSGRRPFVFHCESFAPIFMPFAFQGQGALMRADQLRAFYGHLLRSDHCLGIFSHISETLEQISVFFADSKIDAKLHQSRIGLARDSVAALLQNPLGYDSCLPVFLFTQSAHQNPRSFALRGGYVALLFAQRYLQAGKSGRFIFRAARPHDTELGSAGIDVEFIRQREGRELVWLEGYLPEREQLRLFALSDFLLLASVNLHSVTLMQALAAGAVPVVTDTFGPSNFVRDDDTGIVLKGVRDRVWAVSPGAGVPLDDHTRADALFEPLAEQMFARMSALLASPERVMQMKHAGRREVENRFMGGPYREQFCDEVLRLWSKFRARHRANISRSVCPHSAAMPLCAAADISGYFDSPPHPNLIIDSGKAKVYRFKGIYYCMEGEVRDALDLWSPVYALRPQDPLSGRNAVTATIGNLAAYLLPTDISIQVRTRIMDILAPYPFLYRIGRVFYRAYVAIRRIADRAFRNTTIEAGDTAQYLFLKERIKQRLRPYPLLYGAVSSIFVLLVKAKRIVQTVLRPFGRIYRIAALVYRAILWSAVQCYQMPIAVKDNAWYLLQRLKYTVLASAYVRAQPKVEGSCITSSRSVRMAVKPARADTSRSEGPTLVNASPAASPQALRGAGRDQPHVRLWIFNHPIRGITEQIEFFAHALTQAGWSLSVSRRPAASALNVVIENFAADTVLPIEQFCRRTGKRIAVILTEHVDFLGRQIHFHGTQLKGDDDYMPLIVKRNRLVHLFLLQEYICGFLRLGDLPELRNHQAMMPGIRVHTIPFPALRPIERALAASPTLVPPEYDFVFTGKVTEYRAAILKSISARYKVFVQDTLVSRRRRDGLNAGAKLVLNIPQRRDWPWISTMRIMAGLQCRRASITVGTSGASAISKCCLGISEADVDGVSLREAVSSYEAVFRQCFEAYSRLVHSARNPPFPHEFFECWAALEL